MHHPVGSGCIGRVNIVHMCPRSEMDMGHISHAWMKDMRRQVVFGVSVTVGMVAEALLLVDYSVESDAGDVVGWYH